VPNNTFTFEQTTKYVNDKLQENFKLFNYQHKISEEFDKQNFTHITMKNGQLQIDPTESITRLQIWNQLSLFRNNYNQRIQLANYISDSWGKVEMCDTGEALDKETSANKKEIKKEIKNKLDK
jgi:hypothetical protein